MNITLITEKESQRITVKLGYNELYRTFNISLLKSCNRYNREDLCNKKENNKFNRFTFIELEKKTLENDLGKHNQYDSKSKKISKRIDSREFNQTKNENDVEKKTIDNPEIKKTVEVSKTDTDSALNILALLINRLNKEEEVDNLLRPIKSLMNEPVKKETENKNNQLNNDENPINIRQTRLKDIENKIEARNTQLKNKTTNDNLAVIRDSMSTKEFKPNFKNTKTKIKLLFF